MSLLTLGEKKLNSLRAINNYTKMKDENLKLDLGVNINDVIVRGVADYVKSNGGTVNKQIKEEVQKAVQELKPIQIKIPERPLVKIKTRVHQQFEKALVLSTVERQIFLYGPAGSGKTTLAQDIAKAMSLDFAHISCSAGMSEGHLLGRMLFNGEYAPSEFVRLYENGGVFLFDEIDAADPNTLLVINSAIANGKMSVPNRKDAPTAKRHKDFICIVSGNTLGQGSANYSGRNYMDSAFLDRFALSKVEISYDRNIEKEICGKKYKEIFDILSRARGLIEHNKLNRIISTRAFVSAVKLSEVGYKSNEIIDQLTLGWSSEEVKKCFPKSS